MLLEGARARDECAPVMREDVPNDRRQHGRGLAQPGRRFEEELLAGGQRAFDGGFDLALAVAPRREGERHPGRRRATLGQDGVAAHDLGADPLEQGGDLFLEGGGVGSEGVACGRAAAGRQPDPFGLDGAALAAFPHPRVEPRLEREQSGAPGPRRRLAAPGLEFFDEPRGVAPSQDIATATELERPAVAEAVCVAQRHLGARRRVAVAGRRAGTPGGACGPARRRDGPRARRSPGTRHRPRRPAR